MKTGKTISELAAEIERQQSTKRDLIADTRQISLVNHYAGDGTLGGEIKLDVHAGPAEDDDPMPVSTVAHEQIGSRLNIPRRYYQRMAEEAPQLLVNNVNHWFEHKPERRMVRTLDGRARAFLSDRYHRIDNFDVAQVTLPVLAGTPGLSVVSSEITDTRMYIKAVTDRVQADVKVGDTVQAGVVISNSEVGKGALNVSGMIYRLVCLNGMIAGNAWRKFHVGARADTSEEVYELLSDEALRADDNAIALKVRDLVRASMDQTVFEQRVATLREATERRLEGNPAKAVEILSNTVGLTQGEGGGVLRHLIEGADLSAWGVANAVTRFAQDVDSYDRSTELEQIGAVIIDLPRREWRQLAEAA